MDLNRQASNKDNKCHEAGEDALCHCSSGKHKSITTGTSSHSLCWIEERSGKYCQGHEETETYTLVVAAENGAAENGAADARK